MESLKKISYKAGDVIFFETDIEGHFFIIEKGTVGVFTRNSRGERVILSELHEGEIFGEQAMIDKTERSASAQATSDCILVKVSEEDYQALLKQLPLWASSMLKSFSARLKKMNKKLV